MKGDRERCLAAGMDGYVSKPLHMEELQKVIARLVSVAEVVHATENATTEAPSTPATDAPFSDAVFDPVRILDRVEGDRKLLWRMIDLFFTQADKLIPVIRSASESGDGKGVERAAHKLKGSMGSFGDRRAFEAAQRLEIIGRNGDLLLAEQALASLEVEVARLQAALKTLKEENAPCTS